MPYYHEAILKNIVANKPALGHDFVKDGMPGFGIGELTIKG